MAVNDNDARIIIGLLSRQMATTEQVLDSVTVALAGITALNALLAAQQASLTKLTDGLATTDEILMELKVIRESLDMMVSQL